MMWRLLTLAAVLVPSDAMAERLFGLVIGIDEYAYITDLHGAVNDAEDIAGAVEALGGDVTLLTNAEATRAAVLGAWEDILAEAQPGDRLIVSYAGHGSNEPESTVGSEADGRDENFLLAGYAPRGEAAGQRIRDDEIAALLDRSRDMNVIFVADACHAGTVTRDLNPALGYRYVEPGKLTGDPLPPPPPPPAAGGADRPVALFLAAVDETEKVPEILIDGTPRGALSYAFAESLRGAADLDGDGVLTKGEIETHVRRTVRQVSDGVQRPQSEPAGFENQDLISLSGAPKAPGTEPTPLRDRPFAALPKVSVPHGEVWDDITGIQPAAFAQLRRKGANVYSSVGDLLATAVDRSTLQAVVDKHRLILSLRRLEQSLASIDFSEGDRIYYQGETLSIEVANRSSAHLTILNLSADGTISMLYPLRAYGDPDRMDKSETVTIAAAVSAPFGADHVIAVETADVAKALHDQLGRLEGARDMAGLWDALRLSGGRIKVFPFVTAGTPL